MKKMTQHPEQLPGELYMGNSWEEYGRPPSAFQNSGWKTKRLGTRPLCRDGSPAMRGQHPWFIQEEEVRAAIAGERQKEEPDTFLVGVVEALLERGHAA